MKKFDYGGGGVVDLCDEWIEVFDLGGEVFEVVVVYRFEFVWEEVVEFGS